MNSQTVFTLERLNWRSARDGWLHRPGADRLQSFLERSEAEAHLREREWELRRRINPFRCGGPYLHYQTSFDAARLHDWFLDAGLDPPGPIVDSAPWATMWDRDYPSMTDAQRAVAWEALDRVRLFRIDEGPSTQSLHLVAIPHYERDPYIHGYWGQDYVGSTPYMLVRRRVTADDLCHQLYVDRIVREGVYSDWYSTQSWTRTDVDPFATAAPEENSRYETEPGFYAEHYPVELVSDRGPTPGQTLYLVLRRHWRLEMFENKGWRWSPTEARSCGRAVIAFDTLAAADAYIAFLEAEARTYPSPFRFGTPHEWGPLHASAIWGTLSNLAPIDFANLWTDYTAPDRLWNHWWDESVATFTPEDIALAWSLYETLRFYEVSAVEYRE